MRALAAKLETRAHAGPRLARELLALVPPIAALLLQWALWGLIEPYVWFLFYPAVFVSSWIGGLRAGLAATLLSSALVWWFFVPPAHQIMKEAQQLFPAAVFLGMGILFALFHEQLRKANRSSAEALAATRVANAEISRLYERTKALDELKTRFFSSVSHELRTPLALILGPTERLLASHTLPALARRDLEVVARNARTLHGHVDDLLDVAKVDAGRMDVSYSVIDLARHVRLIAGDFDSLGKERGLELHVEAPAKMRAELDAEKLRRVLLNLLSNAFKFTPPGGRVRVTLAASAMGARLEVADSGPGIPAAQREAVFERFRQLDDGPTRRFGGTGLGLSIARELVQLQRGEISVIDAPEGGACFVIELPTTAPTGAKVEPERARLDEGDARPGTAPHPNEPPEPFVMAARPDRAAWPRVLIVEDNRDLSHFVAEVLADRYRVDVAFDGRQGLEKAKALIPDLVLTDVMMPAMSGDELVRQLRRCPELAATRIIVLTAKADEALRVGLLREGAHDFLMKPFSLEELRARIEGHLGCKLAEDRLREEEAKYRNIISLAADAIISIDERQRIVLFNQSAEATFGWSQAEVVGRPLDVLLPERFRQSHRALVRAFADEESADSDRSRARREVVGLRKSGAEFPGQVAISKLRVGGAWMFTVIVRDISDLKRAVQTRDELLGIVAHDLRNPLGTIRIATHLLARQGEPAPAEGGERPQAADLARNIENAAARMNRLIEDLLDVARIEAGPLPLEKKSLSARGLVTEAVAAQEPLAASAALELALDFGDGRELPEIAGDRDRLLQVFENLIGNAVKFSRPTGRVTVGAEAIDGEVVFRVRDTGVGISADHLPHVFDRFWQARIGGRRGAGLGLPIVKGIVEAHGGRVWVESTPGSGTTFSFTVPASAAP